MTDPDHHAMMEEHASYGRHIQDLEIEVEWLRALKDGQSREIGELRAEVERLRGGRDAYKAVAVERAAEIERLREACSLFTEAAHDAVRALNGAGIACPASIAFAAEKARAALKDRP